MKRNKIFTLLLAVCLTSNVTHAQFPDIPPGHYAENAVDRLTDLGVISGFPDGFFRGQKTINRFELSLILTRMWDSWSTAQLSDLFSEHSHLQVALGQLKQQQSQTEQSLAAVAALQQRLTQTEEVVAQLDARTADTDTIRRALSSLQQDFASLRQVLNSSAQNATDADGRVKQLELQLKKVQNDLNNKLSTLSTRLDEQQKSFNTNFDQLETLIVQQRSWTSQLTLGAGVDGERADYLVGIDLLSPWGEADLQWTGLGPEVKAEAVITPSIAALGRYHSTEFGTQGAFGVRFFLPSQLSISFLGGDDGELVAGATLEHDGTTPGAALPGVTIRVGALTNVAGDNAIGTNLLLQGTAGITLGGPLLNVTPSAFYRRQAGAAEVQTFGGELRLAGATNSFRVTGAARYGIASDASQSTGTPEADLTFELASGAFARVTLSGGLPPLAEPVSFADASPLDAEELILGAKIGITVPLDALGQ